MSQKDERPIIVMNVVMMMMVVVMMRMITMLYDVVTLITRDECAFE